MKTDVKTKLILVQDISTIQGYLKLNMNLWKLFQNRLYPTSWNTEEGKLFQIYKTIVLNTLPLNQLKYSLQT